LSHLCSVCEVVNISSDKTKIRCVQCNEDLIKCLSETNMNLEQFTKRQRERIEIFKRHSLKEIAVMQLKEDIS